MVSFFLLRFPPEGLAAHANTIVGKFSFKKSIKESQPLGKRALTTNSGSFLCRAPKFAALVRLICENPFQFTEFSLFLSENYFHRQKVRFFYNGYKIATTFKISVNPAQRSVFSLKLCDIHKKILSLLGRQPIDKMKIFFYNKANRSGSHTRAAEQNRTTSMSKEKFLMKNSISRRSFLKAVGALSAAGALAACGGSSSSSTAASSTAASAAASTAAGANIKLWTYPSAAGARTRLCRS